ncbi:jacalin-like lectin [Shewanella surugensis]|uniref:Jacalin-type lectin domain-containing protein n=1 Tax=Shewanella surugensis TaxID=212020 RepID=A0ABT0LE28_9GAMM|nr:jacalin-like lectin [Shewanella surugensis]MCL1125956.1 hypothetical protein [Shewanella surugensis]
MTFNSIRHSFKLFIISCLGLLLLPMSLAASEGSFTLLTYNVAGLPDLISGSNPAVNTPLMSPKLNHYDISLHQEDWNYHDELISAANHPYQSNHAGGAGGGDGLTRLSQFPFSAMIREAWDDCNGIFNSGSDCLAPKGFSFTRHQIDPNTVIDIYNVHADAGGSDSDHSARRSNYAQLMSKINAWSLGHAVIVAGDMNSLFLDADEVRVLTDNGFSDVWADIDNNGVIPNVGEWSSDSIDKILFRSSVAVHLSALSFDTPSEAFSDANGHALSDHSPRAALMQYALTDEARIEGAVGGYGGEGFNDLGYLPFVPNVSAVTLRSGSQVDQIAISYVTGQIERHGGGGGHAQTLTLLDDEYFTQAQVCQANNRVSYVALTTNVGRSIAGGTMTHDCELFDAPTDWGISGFWGRSGSLVDRLGIVSLPLTRTNMPVSQVNNIAFKSAHNRYLVADNNGNANVDADRENVGAWETFTLLADNKIDGSCIQNGDSVVIHSQSGWFLRAVSDGELDATASRIGAWERFTLVNHSRDDCIADGDRISLKTTHNTYVVAESNGDVNANRSSAGSWETFTVEFQ